MKAEPLPGISTGDLAIGGLVLAFCGAYLPQVGFARTKIADHKPSHGPPQKNKNNITIKHK